MDLLNLKDIHPTTKRLIFTRAFRSIGQGALVVDLTLYLHALNWTGLRIGLVLSAAGLFGAILSLAVGITSDRLQRKPFLLVYESIALFASIIAFLFSQTIVLIIVIIIAGFGRGANGAAGPFSPVEQAWLAEEVKAIKRGMVYSLNTAIGFFGMGIGALLAMLPSFLSSLFKDGTGVYIVHPSAFRPLFLIVTIASIVNLILLFSTTEQYTGSLKVKTLKQKEKESDIKRQENKMLTGLVFLNSFNGLAIGFTGPLISYWFAIRFGIGPASIAPIMAATFFFTGFSSIVSGKVSEKIGIVQSVVWARFFGLILLIILPIIPVFWIASLIYILRSVFNRGSLGARQALTVGLVRDERRGFATSLNAVSMQIPQSIGPSIAGYLFSAGQLQLPFFAGAFLQGIYLIMYGRFFRNQNRPHDLEEE